MRFHYDLYKEARKPVLEIQVNVALAGYDLRPFEPVEVITGGDMRPDEGAAINSPESGLLGRYIAW